MGMDGNGMPCPRDYLLDAHGAHQIASELVLLNETLSHDAHHQLTQTHHVIHPGHYGQHLASHHTTTYGYVAGSGGSGGGTGSTPPSPTMSHNTAGSGSYHSGPYQMVRLTRV